MISTTNPWHKLPVQAPYILEMDQDWADEYQSAYLSPGNLGEEGFARVVTRLKQTTQN